MQRDYKVFCQDIIEAITKIMGCVDGFTLETFRNDSKTWDAVIRNLEVIGEAVKNIPEETRDESDTIEWSKIAGLRDILIHQYFGIDAEIVWDVIQSKLGDLKKEIEKILSKKTA